ncbi:zinc ribbon domain-containing protein [Nocardia sp. NBC_01388]|uniref:zinc ribbon domain-containing protein n=1 Tax=Nocardia sp. NBC_01388 TaxID=2903596 RepID=UPI0032480C13
MPRSSSAARSSPQRQPTAVSVSTGAFVSLRLELGDRTFRCDRCGFTDDRDRNAARVILAVAERGRTRVDDVGQPNHPFSGGDSDAV